MSLFDFVQYPLWVTLLSFAVAAAVVWFAGTRISGYASAISDQTGIGKAFIGLILLGGITSLPEVAVTATAALRGIAPLAVNNLLGGVAMQVAIIAIADAVFGKGAITGFIAQPVVLLQGALDVLLLVIIAAAVGVAEFGVAGVGVGSLSLVGGYLVSLWLIQKSEREPRWRAAEPGERSGDNGGSDRRPRGELGRSFRRLDRELYGGREDAEEEGAPQEEETEEERRSGEERSGERGDSLARVIAKTTVAGLAILIAGYVLSRTGEAIAEQTGLGTSFVGAVLVAISTSLPEVSTVVSAVRLRQYEMAFSDIFGTNLFDIVLVFVADVLYAGPPVLQEVGRFSLLGALLGIAVTTIYLAGLIERRDRAVLRMGPDSWLVLVVYFAGLFGLYQLR
jgi:cation:H+ antiporter